jgi:hypothetical protein
MSILTLLEPVSTASYIPHPQMIDHHELVAHPPPNQYHQYTNLCCALNVCVRGRGWGSKLLIALARCG